jgi:hypothetical protein
MATTAMFPGARMGSGMYESFYLRAVSPEEPVGVWIRHTVHKPPGRRPTGSVWCTVFDARLGAPFMHKVSTAELSAPAGAWIAVNGDAEMGPGRAQGSCGQARWSLRFASAEPELRHLTPDWLYRAALPRTKLTSLSPAAAFDGVVELEGREAIELRGWQGMVGHNWGAEHAERWIWLHGVGFEDDGEAWIDVGVGRVMMAGRMTPWVANGAVSLDGRRHRIGGLAARGLRVEEDAKGCLLRLPGKRGLTVEARVEVPPGSAAGWRYADPDGGEHEVLNCSVAALELRVQGARGAGTRTLHSPHGGAYELGARPGTLEHGVPIAPFADG